MKKLLILLLGLLLLQISYSRSVLIPKNRPELVISKIYNPSSGKILVIYQCKDWLNRVTNSFAAPEFMIRIGSTIMSLSAADYDWPVSTDGSEWVKVTDLNDMPLTAGTKSPYVQQIRITADVNPQTELRPADGHLLLHGSDADGDRFGHAGSGGPGLPLPVDLLGLDRRTVQLLVERFEHASVDFGQLGLHLRRA